LRGVLHYTNIEQVFLFSKIDPRLIPISITLFAIIKIKSIDIPAFAITSFIYSEILAAK